MFKDSTLQIFLSIYHGSLIATYFYDYIVRNTVRWVLSDFNWNYISNVLLGVLFVAVSIWAILSAWSKIRRNLIICLVALIIIFLVRLGVGIADTAEKHKSWGRSKQYTEELIVFITQIVVHLLGIAATWLLANNSA